MSRCGDADEFLVVPPGFLQLMRMLGVESFMYLRFCCMCFIIVALSFPVRAPVCERDVAVICGTEAWDEAD